MIGCELEFYSFVAHKTRTDVYPSVIEDDVDSCVTIFCPEERDDVPCRLTNTGLRGEINVDYCNLGGRVAREGVDHFLDFGGSAR